MRSLLDQTITIQRAHFSDNVANQTFAGAIAAADSTTIMALAKEGVTVSSLIYTAQDPQAAVGDNLLVAGASYTVVAPARPFVNSQAGLSIFVIPCGVTTG